jgi:hypothetical protein
MIGSRRRGGHGMVAIYPGDDDAGAGVGHLHKQWSFGFARSGVSKRGTGKGGKGYLFCFLLFIWFGLV